MRWKLKIASASSLRSVIRLIKTKPSDHEDQPSVPWPVDISRWFLSLPSKTYKQRSSLWRASFLTGKVSFCEGYVLAYVGLFGSSVSTIGACGEKMSPRPVSSFPVFSATRTTVFPHRFNFLSLGFFAKKENSNLRIAPPVLEKYSGLSRVDWGWRGLTLASCRIKRSFQNHIKVMFHRTVEQHFNYCLIRQRADLKEAACWAIGGSDRS